MTPTFMWVFVTISAYFISTTEAQVPTRTCELANQEFLSCGTPCPPRCDTLNSTVCCEVRCVPGCFCRDGFILLREGESRRCVALDQCPGPGVVEFETTSVVVVESARVVRIAVVRKGGAAGEVRVRWRTRDGSAIGAVDFQPTNGTLVFPDGVTKRFIEIPIIDNDVRNPAKNFFVELVEDVAGNVSVSPRGHSLARGHASARGHVSSRMLVTISDDDDRPQPGFVEMEKMTLSIPENSKTVDVTVVRIGGSDGTLSVRWRTVADSATAGSGFVSDSGVLVFKHGETRKTFTIKIDYKKFEVNEVFKIQLFEPTSDVVGFRNLGSKLILTVTIVDDDLRPGSLQMATSNVTVPESVGVVNVTVVRFGGTDGVLRARFRTVDGAATAGSDYVPAFGQLVFNEGETRKTIPVTIINDRVREPTESFRVELGAITSEAPNFFNRGTILSTTITITDDDSRTGFVEMEMSAISVLENVGSAEVIVVRSGGTDGTLRVQYTTEDGTARGGSDYLSTNGELVFENGVTRRVIRIPILDNNIKEANRDFRVRLLSSNVDVAGGRNLGAILTTTVTIIDNDSQTGYAVVERTSIRVPENVGQATVNVIRLGGSDGTLTVRFQTRDGTAREGEDYIRVSGELEFLDGQTRKTIRVNIVDDDVKEPDETFQVQLFNVTDNVNIPNERDRTVATVTIVDNDSQTGYAVMERTSIRVPESVGQATVNVIRLGGSDGTLMVRFQTRDGTAREGEDYIRVSGELEFLDGQTRKTIRVNIVDDDVKEPDETFQVQLFNVTDNVNIPNERDRTVATVTIVDNDRQSGYAEMEQASVSVPENIGTVRLTVLRLGGTDGTLRVRWRTVDGTAIGGEDFVPGNGELVFLEGETRKIISVTIIDDNLREPDENFRVELTEMTSEPNIVPRAHRSRTVTVVTILANDMNSGVIEFLRASVGHSEGNPKLSVTVIRRRGTDGPVSCRWRTVDRTAVRGQDFVADQGVVRFADGQSSQTIEIEVIDRNRRRGSRDFGVEIFEPTGGAALGLNSAIVVTILDSEATSDPCRIQFRRRRSSVLESAGLVRIPVSRRCSDVSGAVSVFWSTEDRSAKAGLDYEAARGTILFGPRQTEHVIVVRIIEDSIAEPNELFDVVLSEPSAGALVGVPSVHTVEIVDGGTAVQPIQISFRRTSLRVREGVGVVRLTIRRTGGDGPITCRVRTVDGTARAGSDFQRLNTVVSFGRGVSEQTVEVVIIDDSIQESEESFTVELFSPTGGAVILPGLDVVTVTIVDDDMLYGRAFDVQEPDEEEPPLPAIDQPDSILSSCPEGLELRTCADTCPKSCDNLYVRNACGRKGCLRGCHCPDGFVLDRTNSTTCVRPAQCPGGEIEYNPVSTKLCPGNLIRLSCKPSCLPSCKSLTCPIEPRSLLGGSLPVSCSSGCGCPPPLVLESPDGDKCVELSLCFSVVE